jgi:hypothetical protein
MVSRRPGRATARGGAYRWRRVRGAARCRKPNLGETCGATKRFVGLRRVTRILVLLTAAGLSAAMGSCGTSADDPGSATRTATPAPTLPAQLPSTALDETERASDAFSEFVDYYQEGGPPGCVPDERHDLDFGHSILTPNEDQSAEGSDQLQQGETMEVCWPSVTGSVTFTVVRSGRTIASSTNDVPSFFYDVSIDAPLGSYSIRAQSGELVTTREFAVVAATEPVYSVAEKDGDQVLAIRGLEPGQTGELAFYESSIAEPERPQARLTGQRPFRADAQGEAITVLGDRPADGAPCTRAMIAKVVVSGRMLDDLNNTLSLFSAACANDAG